MALEGLAADVDIDQVHALLLARTPSILEPDSPDYALYEGSVRGVTTEVVAITGANPSGTYRELAVWAITVGVAAQLESALFPEQQLGDSSRAATLQARYDTLLGRLASSKDAGGDIASVARPVGSFPAATAYPDPAEQPCRPVFYRG